MLKSIRHASQGPVGRAIMTVLLGLIVVSFAIWGIGDVFRGFGVNKVASVGGVTITPDEFHAAYQAIQQRFQRQMKVSLTPAQAHAMGLDRQTLTRLIGEAALDSEARSLGLAISDATIAKSILDDPGLKDPSGNFSRDRFEEALRENGVSERGFVVKQRQVHLRQQIGVALVDGIEAPRTLVEALLRVDAETRDIDYFVLTAASAGEIAPATPDALETFFNERKASYSAPEYRAINVLSLTPESIAKPDAVTDADARARYDNVKDARYGAPEKRSVQQIVFPNEGEADEALTRIKAGASFDDIAKERKLTDKDIDLGDGPRAGIYDKAVADAAFALSAPGVTEVIKGQFGPTIARVSQITPANLKPYEEVAPALKKEIALNRAVDDILALHDKVEDARASGKSLTQAAGPLGLEVNAIPAIDAKGDDKAGAPVPGLNDQADLLRAVFASDVGADDQPIATKDRGFEWFEVTKVEPTRLRTFDEVKDRVATEWKDDQTAKALAAKATQLVQKLNAGATVASLAEPGGLEVKKAAGIHRREGGDLNEAVVTAVFSAPSGGAGSAATPQGRVVFKITGDAVPPFDPDNAATKAIASKASASLSDEVINQYVTALERQFGVTVNEDALRAAESN